MTNSPTLPPDVAALGYEAAREALVEVVRNLESGGTTLEDALALWERGEALAAHCEAWLAGARSRMTSTAEGNPASNDA